MLLLIISIFLFVLLTSYGIIYIIDKRLSNIQINIPKQNINLKMIGNNNLPKNGFNPKTKPLRYDDRPLINPTSYHEIPNKQPIKKYNSNSIPKCSA